VTAGPVLLLAASDDQQKAGPLGLLVLLLLCVACYFLFKSMSRHLRRVRDDFPDRTSPTTVDRLPATTGSEVDRPPAAPDAAGDPLPPIE
jgi:hypothetical protein